MPTADYTDSGGVVGSHSVRIPRVAEHLMRRDPGRTTARGWQTASR
jgi:hypothetical protein